MTTAPLVIACGALASELRAVLRAQGLDDAVDVTYLPANLHNRPERIVPELEPLLDEAAVQGRAVFIGYADCGTGGALDALLERHPEATRLPGSHCYEFFSGSDAFAAMHEEELGTFFLTDFLAKHFDALLWQGLGLDKHPQLLDMTFTQLIRPGAPVIFGSFASSMSMQTGAPTFGTPEPAIVLYTIAALARRLGVPFRSGGSLSASKIPDAQAAYESAATLLPTVLAGTNFVLHAAGWLEGGLAIGYEKFIMDEDQCGMMATFVKGLDLSENGQAIDAIRDNGPGQHFLGTAHTFANFETAFYRSNIADNSSFEQWTEDGATDAPRRANAIWKKRLSEYEMPPMDEAIAEELNEFVDRRKQELPDEFA